MQTKIEEWPDRLRHGIGVGIKYATGYSALALVIQFVAGGLTTGHGWYTAARYVGVYFFAGFLGGAVWGLLKPLTKTKIGLMTVLSIIGMIFYSTGMYTFLNLNQKTSDPGLWVLTELVGVIFGIAVGGKMWRRKTHS